MGREDESDEALFAAYVAGDEAAFTRLFDRYAPQLLRMLRPQLGEEDAREVVQQTFLQAHRARHDFRPGARLRPWLVTIAFNLQRSVFRRRGRRPEAPLEVDPAGSAPAVGDAAERNEAVGRLRSALASLPQGQREVVELHWLQGLPFPEVAQVTGASLSAVKVRAHRAYKLLRARLDGRADGAGA